MTLANATFVLVYLQTQVIRPKEQTEQDVLLKAIEIMYNERKRIEAAVPIEYRN